MEEALNTLAKRLDQFEADNAELRARYAELTAQTGAQYAELKAEFEVVHPVMRDMALRDLMDRSRGLMLGRSLSRSDRGQRAWHAILRKVTPATLSMWGFDRKDLDVTRYGLNSLQHGGNWAAHNVPPKIIVKAVLCAPPKLMGALRKHFIFVFKASPEAALSK